MAARILFTIPNFITAGSGRALLNIVERLDRARFAPAVCVSKRGGKLDAEVERAGVELIEAPFTVRAKPYATLLGRARGAAQPFRDRGFVLWHSFHYGDDYTEPIIARFAGARRWIYTKKNMSWGGRAWRVRSLLASRIAAQNTDMMTRFFDSSWYRGKARLIPRGVDTSRFRPDATTTLALRDRLGIDRSTPLVGCVAQLVPVKGHRTLLDAIASIPRCHLLLAGAELDTEYGAGLRARASAPDLCGRVHVLGAVSDVPALLAELDLFVLPTSRTRWEGEGCPVALLEAMACERACIATDVAGSRDVIVPDQSGILVEPDSAPALASAIRRLIDDPGLRYRLASAARARILERYTIEREVRLHEALYAELLA